MHKHDDDGDDNKVSVENEEQQQSETMVRSQLLGSSVSSRNSVIHPVETYMMRQYSMSYTETSELVASFRSRLGLPPDEWTEELKCECERVFQSASSKLDITKAMRNEEEMSKITLLKEVFEAPNVAQVVTTTKKAAVLTRTEEETSEVTEETTESETTTEQATTSLVLEESKSTSDSLQPGSYSTKKPPVKFKSSRLQFLQNHSLEQILMHQYGGGMTYSKANALVMNARATLGMPKHVPWDEQLKKAACKLASEEEELSAAAKSSLKSTTTTVEESTTEETTETEVTDAAPCIEEAITIQERTRSASHETTVVTKDVGNPGNNVSTEALNNNRADSLLLTADEIKEERKKEVSGGGEMVESILVRRYGVSSSNASYIVLEARAALGIPEWQQWNDMLLKKCEQLVVEQQDVAAAEVSCTDEENHSTTNESVTKTAKPQLQVREAVKASKPLKSTVDESPTEEATETETTDTPSIEEANKENSPARETADITKAVAPSKVAQSNRTGDSGSTEAERAVEASDVIDGEEEPAADCMQVQECKEQHDGIEEEECTEEEEEEEAPSATVENKGRPVVVKRTNSCRLQFFADPSATARPLETILMGRHNINWSTASVIVAKGRSTLRMEKFEPWTMELEALCEQLCQSDLVCGEEVDGNSANGIADEIKLDALCEQLRQCERFRQTLDNYSGEDDAIGDGMIGEEVVEEEPNRDVLVGKANREEPHGKDPSKLTPDDCSAGSGCLSSGEDINAEQEALQIELGKDGTELTIDDCSQVSRCPSLGATIIAEEEEQQDEEASAAPGDSLDYSSSKSPGAEVKTADTEETFLHSNIISIPNVIYIRTNGAPEVPGDEPLGVPLGLRRTPPTKKSPSSFLSRIRKSFRKKRTRVAI